MTGFVMRPRILAPEEGELHDTFRACIGRRHSAYKYVHGGAPMHFTVPAVIYHAYLPTPSQPQVHVWEYSRFSCEPYEVTYNRLVKTIPMDGSND